MTHEAIREWEERDLRRHIAEIRNFPQYPEGDWREWARMYGALRARANMLADDLERLFSRDRGR